MLPDPQHPPAPETKLFGNYAITLAVFSNLGNPELAVLDRRIKMFWASMPKTPVDENGDTLFSEYKIRPSKDRRMPAPPTKLVTPKERR